MYQEAILIVGAGSIGERHIRNLWNLGYKNIHIFRQRNLPFRNIGEAKVTVHLNWNEITKLKPFLSIIATPTSSHLTNAIECAKLGSHLLIEKPLSNSTDNIDFLKKIVIKKKIYLRIAYMMRFHPLICKMKSILDNQTYGGLLSYSSKWSEYLPDWHPWEDYRNSYASKKSLGGGAALTLSHDIDLAIWFCNSIIKKYAIFKNYNSKLEIDVEGGADILLQFGNGIIANVQLNYFERTPERTIKLVFDNGSVFFDYFKNQLTVKTSTSTQTSQIDNFDRNDMFISQIKFFFDKINNYSVDESINQLNESSLIINICNGY